MGLLASDESIVVVLALNSDIPLVNVQFYIKELKTNSRKKVHKQPNQYVLKVYGKNYEPFKPAIGLLASDESIVVILALNSDMSLVNGQTKSHWHP